MEGRIIFLLEPSMRVLLDDWLPAWDIKKF